MVRIVEKITLGIPTSILAAYMLFPERVESHLQPVIDIFINALLWANTNLPRPVFLGAIFLVTASATILVAFSVARVFYLIGRHAGPRTKRVYRMVTPSTPIGKVGFAFGLTIAFLIGSVWAIPYIVGDLSESTGVDSTADIANQSQNNDTLQQGVADNSISLLQEDVTSLDSTGGSTPLYDRPTPDADGDRLKGIWERAERTPGGAFLPNADPQRMDLYVQINYGSGETPLSEAEKRQLKRIWANMPVENPDGSTGITLHIRDSKPTGGPLGAQATFTGQSPGEIHRFYTRQYLRDRMCRYHQVVIGDITDSSVAGIANTPGYASAVEGKRRNYDGNISFRVYVITHELLHNVAGKVNGKRHTETGWLAPVMNASGTSLSNATAQKLNEQGLVGSGYYQQEICNR